MYVVSKQARKSDLKKTKYIENWVYRDLRVAYPLGCKNICSKVLKCKFPFQLKSDSQLPNFFLIWAPESPLKMMKNAFLFHLESSFRSQDIYIFVLTFWSYRKNGLIRNIRLISNFMTLQPG